MKNKLQKLSTVSIRKSDSLPQIKLHSNSSKINKYKYKQTEKQNNDTRGLLFPSIEALTNEINDYQKSVKQLIIKSNFLDHLDNEYLKELFMCLVTKVNNSTLEQNYGVYEKDKIYKNLEKFMRKNKTQNLDLLKIDVQRLRSYIMNQNTYDYKSKVRKFILNIKKQQYQIRKNQSFQAKYVDLFDSFKIYIPNRFYRKPINERIQDIQLKHGKLDLISPKFLQKDKILINATKNLKQP